MEMKFKAINEQINAADPISGICSLRTSDGTEFILCSSGPKLFLREGDREIGSIMRSSLMSGSVWSGGDCIGEYSFAGDEYEVIPIKGGLLELASVERIHPIDFLIQRSQFRR